MPVAPGTRIGPYEILSTVGAGGMGQVYRARDTKLNRDVALKTLLESVVGDHERRTRFQREAQVLASLNHPNIAHIYGFEEGQTSFLVMEYVGGETLAERIARGGMPWTEAVAIARQIADALDSAHELAIVHRDLKPANIKLRDDGTVKVLDFGLAKALSPDGSRGSADPMNSPTMTSPAMTAMGMILGTAGYMSPEQARGRPVDKRADIWSFGVVLYEMLTGKMLFTGDTITDVIAAVITREPDWSLLPADMPVALQRLLARCLEKDPKRRLRDIGDARVALDEATTPAAPTVSGAVTAVASTAVTPAAMVARRRAPIAAFAMVAAVALAIGALASRWLWRGAPVATPSSSSVVASITAAPEALSAFIYGFDLSPNGATLIYTAKTADGYRRLWKRELSESRATPLAGTEGAMYPFFSPDGRDLAYFARGVLYRIPIGGGPTQVVCAVPGTWPHGSWGSRGDILYSTAFGPNSVVLKVAATGGQPQELPLARGATNPIWLPDGTHFLYIDESKETAELFVTDIAGGQGTRLLDFEAIPGQDPQVRLSSAGFLVFDRAGVLNAQRFDLATQTLAGPIVPIGDRVGTPRAWLAASVSGGTVAALNPSVSLLGGTPGDPIARLKWIDRTGRVIGELGPRGRYWTMRLSHDGTRVAVNPEDRMWTIDARTNGRTRLWIGNVPIWSADDRQIVYRADTGALFAGPWTGEVPPRSIVQVDGAAISLGDASPDGKTIVATRRAAEGARSLDVVLVDLASGAAKIFVGTDADEMQPAYSSDGKWIAYASNATGRREIYVRAIAGDGSIQISIEGGDHPFWRRDSKELFFISPTDEVFAVDMSSFAASRQPGDRRRLFQISMNDITRENYPPYAVTPDGQRFLVNVPEAPEPLTLIQGVDRLIKK